MIKLQVQQYISALGVNPFEKWFERLDAIAAAKISVSLYRLEHGNFSNVEGVGGGIFEYKINFGPGYRIYFGQEGDRFIILLGGGTKKRQSQDVEMAKKYWTEYKMIKKRGDNHGINKRF